MFKSRKGITPRTKTVKKAAHQPLGGRDWARFRLAAVGMLFCLVWIALWGRAFYVQIYRGPEFAAKAKRQHQATELVTGRRGAILDRNGQMLARSVASKSVFVRPVEVENPAEATRVLSSALGLSVRDVRNKLSEHRQFTWIARRVGDRAALTVKDAHVRGVYLTTEYSRLYPNHQLAGRLLGFVGMDDKGLEGIELVKEDQLSGQDSKYVVQRDAAGRRLYLNGAERDHSIDGQDVRLTLDAQIQFFAEEALAEAVTSFEASWGGVLMADVKSGDILAWAEYPPFNPNTYNQYAPQQWRNRIATDALEMGSTIKPFLVASALEEGKVTPESLYFCENGKWQLRSMRIKDTHKYEWLPVDKVLRYSSNIGSAKIGLELGATAYHGYLSRLGFGERTGLPVRGESTGILRPAGQWHEVDLANAAFGQGFSATMLQLMQAYVCLANGGERKPLRILMDESATGGKSERVFSAETSRKVLAMMRGVVEEDGTGVAARIPGIRIGGKTGTAQKASAQGGYGDKYVGSFVGLIPAEAPQYVLMVVIDEPAKAHYGSMVAAPAFKQIAMRSMAYMGTLPDTGADTSILADAGAADTAGHQAGPSEIRRDVSHEAIVDDNQVPNVCGKSLRYAVEAFARKGIIPTVRGDGFFVKKQSPAPGIAWPKEGAQNYVLWLSERS